MRVYWCSDSCFRGCILYTVFKSIGVNVIVPISPVNPRTLRLRKRGSTFKHEDVLNIIRKNNCSIPDLPKGSWRGSGDVDLLLSYKGFTYIFEVKSRIVPRLVKYGGFNAARLALRYHLDEFSGALEAWQRLENINKKVIEEFLDKPASIGELARATIAVSSGLVVKGLSNNERIVTGTILPFYARHLLAPVKEYVSRTSQWVSRCLGIEVRPAIMLVKPDKLGIPSWVVLECVSESCGSLPARIDVRVALPEKAGACGECAYSRFCSGMFTPIK